jgi:hypothetical protein
MANGGYFIRYMDRSFLEPTRDESLFSFGSANSCVAPIIRPWWRVSQRIDEIAAAQ